MKISKQELVCYSDNIPRLFFNRFKINENYISINVGNIGI